MGPLRAPKSPLSLPVTSEMLLYFHCSYKTHFVHLKALKVEIEHLQLLMEKAKVKLQKEFEDWWAEEATRLQVLVMMLLGSHRPLPPCDLETLKAAGEGQTFNPLEQLWGRGSFRPAGPCVLGP